MLDVATALEDERPQPFLGQLLGRPAAADARPDDDRVVGALGGAGGLDVHDGQRILAPLCARNREGW